MARTRRRLRQLEVRRRHWASEQRPAAGWASLTDIERATTRLGAEGLTNQQIADQLFISTHTVAFHLRQVFRKLDIRSRVDLARIALEHAGPRRRKPHDWGMRGGPCGGETDLMLTTGMQNLLEPMARAPVAYHGWTARLAPASADRLARRVEYFASSVQFVLGDPDAARRLQVLRGAMALVGGDFRNIQIVHPATGSLRLVTRAGFGLEFPDYFAVVEDVHSACGRAARQGAQTAVADVRADPGFRPHREIAAAAGLRAVQSTPLVDYAGHLIGMVSTHFRRPHRPSDRDLQIVELYADFAGEALTAHLGRPPGDGPADPVGRAMVTAMPDPARVREADVSVPFELWVMGRMTISFVRRAGRRGPSAQPV